MKSAPAAALVFNQVARDGCLIGAMGVAAAAVWSSKAMALGLLAGATVAVVNLVFLTHLLIRVFEGRAHGRISIKVLLLLAGKYLGLFAVVFTLVAMWGIDGLGFCIGFSAVIPSLLIRVWLVGSAAEADTET